MWVKIQRLGEGQHPSELVIGVPTSDGTMERLIVDRRSLENDAIDVGYPVGGDDKRLLVELPRETIGGQWRVWLNKEDVLEGIPA